MPASSGDMPQPSSVTRMNSRPPPRSSTVTFRAPASTAFSSSSFTTEAGRSTTSPAAMRSATKGESMLILGNGDTFFLPCCFLGYYIVKALNFPLPNDKI